MDTSDNTHIEQTEQQPLEASHQHQQQPAAADSSSTDGPTTTTTTTKSGQIGARLQNAKERQNRQKYEQS